MHVVTSCGTNPDRTMFRFTIKLLTDGNLANQLSLGGGLEDLKAAQPCYSMPVLMKLRWGQWFTAPLRPLTGRQWKTPTTMNLVVEVRWSPDCCVIHSELSIYLHYTQLKTLLMETGLMEMFASVILNTAQDFDGRCVQKFVFYQNKCTGTFFFSVRSQEINSNIT